MRLIELTLGILFFLAGVSYFYWPRVVMRMNAWARKYIFNDQLLVTHRRKIGLVLLVVSSILLCGGLFRR